MKNAFRPEPWLIDLFSPSRDHPMNSQGILPGHDLRPRVSDLGRRLADGLAQVLEAIPGQPAGPQRLAQALGLDKVFTSRLLKALRSREPLSVVHLLPGPDPLRRFLRAARAAGVAKPSISAVEKVVSEFESLIRDEAGDRGVLGSILSAWLPEVRAEQELRSRQSAFRALGQIRGAQAEFDHSTVLLHPSADPGRVDVVWLIGVVGVQRLRPDAVIRFDTRRVAPNPSSRRPTDLEGEELHGPGGVRDEFRSGPPAPIEVRQVGEIVHYLLGDTGFGPRSVVDVLFCEVNRSELAATVPAGTDRRAWFYADVKTPAKRLSFDVFVHRDLYPSTEPELLVYDTSIRGVADVNDPGRDIDRMQTSDSPFSLGYGLDRTPLNELPRYRDLLEHVYGSLGWEAEAFRGYRLRSDYPLYGSQLCFAFRPPEDLGLDQAP